MSIDVVTATVSTPFVDAYPWSSSTGFGSKYTNPATLPAGVGIGAKFSPDGTAVAIAHSTTPFVSVYPWTLAVGFGAKYTNPATLPPDECEDVAFSPSGDAIAVAIGNRTGVSSGSPWIHAYPWSGSGFGTKYSNPASLGAVNTGIGSGADGVTFAPNGATVFLSYVAQSGTSKAFASAWPWSAGFGVKYTDLVITGKSSSVGVRIAVSPDSADVAVAFAGSAPAQGIAAFPFSGGFGTQYTVPSPAQTGGDVAFSADGNTIFASYSGGGTPNVHAWPWSAGFGTAYTDPTGTVSTANGIAVSGNVGVVATFSFTPFIKGWRFSAGAFGSPVSNPSTLPPSQCIGVSFTPFVLEPPPTPAADYPCLVGNPVIWGATSDINGDVFQFSKVPLRDPASYYGGYKAPRLLEMGPITRAASDFLTGTWSAQTAWMRLADIDYEFRNLGYQPSLINREAWFYLLSENTRRAQGNPALLFHGPVYNDPFSEDFTYTINANDYVGSNYNLFKDDKMIPQRTVTIDDFPACPNQSLGLGVPIIGGVVSETDGAIKVFSVGTLTVSATSYAVAMVCGHACDGGIIEAYDDTGTPLAWGSDAFAPGQASWTTIQPGGELYYDINGNRYTLIFIDASTGIGTAFLDGTASIYVNTNGMEPNGDGTGTVIEDLFELRKYLMVQWYTQSYENGSWLSGATFEFYPGMGAGYGVVDEDSFDTAQTQSIVYQGGAGFQGAFVIGAGGRRQSIRERLADDNVSSCTWMGLNAQNQIFVYLLDRTNATFLGSNRTLTDRRDILKNPKFKIEPRLDWFANDLGYQYAANYRDDGRGDWNGHNVQGHAPSVVKYGTVTGRRTYGLVRDSATADLVASLQLIIGGPDPPRIVTWTQSLCGMGQDILTGWPMTHYQGRGASGWVENPVLILSQVFNPSDCRTTFTGLDVEGILLGID